MPAPSIVHRHQAKRLAEQKVGDANDAMYQWASSRDFDPAPALDNIKARVRVINSADDERNPLELGVLERGLKRIANSGAFIVPGSPDTRGHGTTGSPAKPYAKELGQFLSRVPARAK